MARPVCDCISLARGKNWGCTRTLCPELDSSGNLPEDLGLRDQREHLICDTSAVHTAQIRLIQTTKQAIVLQIEVQGHRGNGETSEDQVDVDPQKIHLDDRGEGIRHGRKLLDGTGWRNALENIDEMRKEVIASDVLGCENEGIDIGAYSKSRASESECARAQI